MSFFKDFKEDLTQAVNELLPDDELVNEFEDADMVNTLDEETEADTEIDKLEELFGESKESEIVDDIIEEVVQEEAEEIVDNEAIEESVEPVEETSEPVEETNEPAEEVLEPVSDKDTIVDTIEEEKLEVEFEDDALIVDTIEDIDMQEKDMNTNIEEKKEVVTPVNVQPTNEVTVITKGTKIIGDIESDGSIEIQGVISGNVNCSGKITVTGEITGDSKSTEFYADKAKIEGEIVTSGIAKIGMGSVIIGSITATSAVVAGAIKGDIDVKGPVVVDNSAVVMGNIKSKSVQINKGAVIEGFCSQCYADIDVKSLFGDNK